MRYLRREDDLQAGLATELSQGPRQRLGWYVEIVRQRHVDALCLHGLRGYRLREETWRADQSAERTPNEQP